MTRAFTKYQGTGNDFILFDNRDGQIGHDWREGFAQCCDRRFGIGADGIILLEDHPTHDFRMIYFNADGGEGSMCGNGGRCTVQFAASLGLIQDSCTFEAIDGMHEAKITKGLVHLKMSDVNHIEAIEDEWFLDTGSPHHMVIVDALSRVDVFARGKAIRNNDRYKKEGTNVNFLAIENPNEISVGTYERGVEDVTLSCGTGVTAAAITTAIKENFPVGNFSVQIKTDGGKLSVSGNRKGEFEFTNLWLIGPAQKTFSGEVELRHA